MGRRRAQRSALRLGWVLLVRLGAWRQLNPRMSAAVVDRIPRTREAGVGEGAHGDLNGRLFLTFLGVEHGRSADRAEPESELAPLVTDANVLSCVAKDFVRGGKRCQRCKDTARSTLTGEAVANADPEWFTLNFSAQLAAGTRGCSRTH
jgi:hypothetical protein